MEFIKSFYVYLVTKLKDFISYLRGKDVKIIKLDESGSYRKIKIKKRRPGYKDIFTAQNPKKTAIVILLLFVFLLFIYLFAGTRNIPEWLFGHSKFDFDYKSEESK